MMEPVPPASGGFATLQYSVTTAWQRILGGKSRRRILESGSWRSLPLKHSLPECVRSVRARRQNNVRKNTLECKTQRHNRYASTYSDPAWWRTHRHQVLVKRPNGPPSRTPASTRPLAERAHDRASGGFPHNHRACIALRLRMGHRPAEAGHGGPQPPFGRPPDQGWSSGKAMAIGEPQIEKRRQNRSCRTSSACRALSSPT